MPARRRQGIGLVTVVVDDYERALDFFVGTLGFALLEDSPREPEGKRWVTVAPQDSDGTGLLLARAANPAQSEQIGRQAGGRVFLFLYTDDFWRDYEEYRRKGVAFVETPRSEPYGTVAVFEDLWGNRWDLLQTRSDGDGND